MAITREMALDLIDTYGEGDVNNIEYIVTTNSDTIRLDWYERVGFGWQWVDKDMGGGNYRTGFEFYSSIPHSIEKSLDENATKTISFIEVQCLDRIAFKSPSAPSWAWQPTPP